MILMMVAACGKGGDGGSAATPGDPYADVRAAIAKARTPAELDRANGACIRLAARRGGAAAQDPFADESFARHCHLDITKARIELWLARGIDCVMDLSMAEIAHEELLEQGHQALAAELEPSLAKVKAACERRPSR